MLSLLFGSRNLQVMHIQCYQFMGLLYGHRGLDVCALERLECCPSASCVTHSDVMSTKPTINPHKRQYEEVHDGAEDAEDSLLYPNCQYMSCSR